MEFNDPIISIARKGTSDSPFQSIEESLIVDSSAKVQLTEYPHRYNRVIVTGDSKDWYETDSTIPDENSYHVDYLHKIVTFNIANIGKQLNFEYQGIGTSLISAKNIYTERNGLEVVDTLQTLTDTTKEARDSANQTNENIQQAENVRVQNENTRKSEHDAAMNEVDETITTANNRIDEVVEDTNTMIADTSYIEPYNATTTYKRNNVVSFNGHSFIAKQSTQGNPPPDPEVANENAYWGLAARKGADGTGTVKTPVDTFTATEGQKVFTLRYTYDQFQGRTKVTVGGVPQFTPEHYEETSSKSITLNEGVPAGTIVKVEYFSESVPLQSDIQNTVDNHTGVISDHASRLNNHDTELNSVTAQLAQIGINPMHPPIPMVAAKGDGITDDTTAIQNLFNGVPEGSKLVFPNAFFKVSNRLSITKKLTIQGFKKPTWDGANYVDGTVFFGAGLFIQASGVTIEDVGVDAPEHPNAYEILATTEVRDVTFKNCVGSVRDHVFLFQSYNGLVSGIDVENCEARNAIHGFISKATRVNFTNCNAYDCSTNGFGLVSDNIPSALKKGLALSNKLVNCHAVNCFNGYNLYSRDMFSVSNENQIINAYHVFSNCIAEGCTSSFRFGESSANAPSGQTYNPILDVTAQNLVSKGEIQYSLEANYTNRLSILGITFEKEMYISSRNNPNLKLEMNSGLAKATGFTNILDLDQNSPTPTVDFGTGLFKTNNTSLTFITNFLNGKEDKLITILFFDDNTIIENGGNFYLNRSNYEGNGSYLVLKYQDGKWFEVIGHKAYKGTSTKDIVASGAPIDIKKNYAIDVYGSGDTANKIDFSGRNPDNNVVTMVIRSTSGTLTFGGFSSNFIVPSDFPLSSNFGTAIVSQWVFMQSLGKWICMHHSTSPYV